MKFRELKRFTGETLEDVVSWLINSLNSLLRELYIGLTSLDLQENFGSYLWTGTLATSEVRQIPHPFKKIPRGYIIHKQVGNALVDASTSEWDKDFVYLRNNSGANTVTLTVLFFA